MNAATIVELVIALVNALGPESPTIVQCVERAMSGGDWRDALAKERVENIVPGLSLPIDMAAAKALGAMGKS